MPDAIWTSCVVVSEPSEVSTRYMPALWDSTAVTPASCLSREGHVGRVFGKGHFDDVGSRHACLERHWSIERNQFSMVHDGDAVA